MALDEAAFAQEPLTFDVVAKFGLAPEGDSLHAGLMQGTDGALYGATIGGGSGGWGTVFKVNPDGTGFTVLKNFDYSTTGGYPYAGLIQGTDGALYGTARGGGRRGHGTVFKLNPDGTGFTVLKDFNRATTGGYPFAGLIQGTDGALYGTAFEGGSRGNGTVFKLNPDGTGFTVLKHVNRVATGGDLYAGLMQGTDGALYGTTTGAGLNYGTIFKLNPDGTGFTVLKKFAPTTGARPHGALMQGTDGALYGTTLYGGGSTSYGTVFKLNPDGTGFTVLKSFDVPTPGRPYGALMQGADGALYGTVSEGGSGGAGAVFKLNPDGTGFTVLKNFNPATTGGSPSAGLIQGTDGALYGTAYGGSGGAGTVFKLNPDGTSFAVLKSFYGPATGRSPKGVMQGTDGALYGTASSGGSGSWGTVFKLNPDGTGLTVLKNFAGSTTGGLLSDGLMQGTDGALYGTASHGGSSDYGTVFKLNPDGTGFTVLKSLDNSTGGSPRAGLIEGTDGALYGTASIGGSSGHGTVFKLNPDGTGFTVLKNLEASTTGAYPHAGLIQGTDGALYGTAPYGGRRTHGTVFKLNPDGTGFTVLRNLNSAKTGGSPLAALIQGADGVLYGTASSGGSSGDGTVFKLNPDGTRFAVLKSFDKPTTGGSPHAGLMQGTDGALYGTTTTGGSGGYGTVFKLNPDRTGFAVLKSFDFFTTGGDPNGLIQGADGALYGTASNGGGAAGLVFRLSASSP